MQASEPARDCALLGYYFFKKKINLMDPEKILFLGVLLLALGLLLIIYSIINLGEGKAKFAIVGFLGPIPFGFGNDRALVIFLLILSIVLFLAFLIFLKSF